MTSKKNQEEKTLSRHQFFYDFQVADDNYRVL